MFFWPCSARKPQNGLGWQAWALSLVNDFKRVICFLQVFLCLWLIHDVHFHDLSSHFLVTHDESIDFIHLLTAFLSHGTSGKSVFCRLFHFLSWAILKQNWFSLGAPMFCHQTWSSFSWSHKSFVGHAHWKSWFHIVFYSIFKPWAPLEGQIRHQIRPSPPAVSLSSRLEFVQFYCQRTHLW